jgi:hypothetical protein
MNRKMSPSLLAGLNSRVLAKDKSGCSPTPIFLLRGCPDVFSPGVELLASSLSRAFGGNGDCTAFDFGLTAAISLNAALRSMPRMSGRAGISGRELVGPTAIPTLAFEHLDDISGFGIYDCSDQF